MVDGGNACGRQDFTELLGFVLYLQKENLNNLFRVTIYNIICDGTRLY